MDKCSLVPRSGYGPMKCLVAGLSERELEDLTRRQSPQAGNVRGTFQASGKLALTTCTAQARTPFSKCQGTDTETGRNPTPGGCTGFFCSPRAGLKQQACLVAGPPEGRAWSRLDRLQSPQAETGRDQGFWEACDGVVQCSGLCSAVQQLQQLLGRSRANKYTGLVSGAPGDSCTHLIPPRNHLEGKKHTWQQGLQRTGLRSAW